MILGAALSISFTACSPGSFLPGEDPLTTPNYRPVNTACDMQVSGPTLTAQTLRSLIRCFNAYGALDPIEKVTEKLSDQDLQPVADTLSRYLLTKPTTLYELDQSYQSLEDQGKVQTMYANLSRVLKHPQFVVSALTLLKDGYFQSPTPLNWLTPPPADRNFLEAMNYLSSKMTPGNFATGIDVGLTVTGAPAFHSLQTKFRGSNPDGQTLRELTDAALAYAQNNGAGVGGRVVRGLIREDLFQALDEAIGGAGEDAIQQGTDRLSSVFRATLAGDGAIFDGMTSLFSALHVPLHCMKGTQTVPDGDMFMLEELARQSSSDVSEYVRVTNPLTIISVNPFCNYPAGLAQYYPSVIDLAQTNAMEPSADLLKALYRPETNDPVNGLRRPLAQLLVDALADPSIKGVIPVMTELNARNAWDDLLLLAELPREQDRDSISSALKYLYDPIPGTNTSVYDVILSSLARVQPGDFYRFVRSLGGFTNSSNPAFQPLLQSFRDFYYVNDTHPVAKIARQLFRDAPANEAFFTTLFKTVSMPEFRDSIRLLATMAKDGRLKQITDGLFAIFRRFSNTGSVVIHPATEPPFVPKSRHQLDDSNLTPYPVSTHPVDPNDPCSHLDLTFGVNQFDDTNYDQKLNDTVKCLARKPEDQAILDSVQFLRSQKSEENGWDFFRLPIELVENFNPSQSELQYLTGSWLTSFDSGYFFNLLDTVPFLVNRNIEPQPGQSFPAGQVLRPLFDLAGPLVTPDARPKLHTVEHFVATQLRRDDFPKTLKVAHDLSQEVLEPQYTPVVTQFDRARIERWVGNKECERTEFKDNPDDPEIRSSQIIDDFDNAVNNWSLENGEPRRSWSFNDVKTLLEPTVDKLSNPSLDAPDKPLLTAFLHILRFFTLKPGEAPDQYRHYTPEDFIQWLKDRSEDYRLITYYYRDANGNFEKEPRVRLVNTLDRMELVLVDADFTVNALGLQVVGNSSLQYTAELAEAWGDEPRSIWPDRIKKLFPPGKPIRKIKDVIDDMYKSQAMFEDLVGFPKHPSCRQVADPSDPPAVQKAETTWPKNRSGIHFPEIGLFRNVERSLYNLDQVLEVLDENRPLDPGENPDDRPHAGGMRVLRDIMYELYFSTPAKYRSYKLKKSQEWRNNLKVADDLSRLGLFRILGQEIRRFQGNEQDLRDAMTSFLMSSTLPETKDALTAVLSNQRDPNHVVFWTTLKKVFEVLDNAEGTFTSAQQAKLAALPRDQAEEQASEWTREAGRMKQLGYYSLALGSPLKLTAPMMSAIATAMNSYPEYLASHADKIDSLLRSKSASYFMRALYQEPDPQKKELVARILRNALSDPQLIRSGLGLLQAIDQDPAAQNAWSVFSDRKAAMLALPEFQPYRQSYDRFNNDLISFFSDQSTDPNEVMASDHLRHYVADMLDQGQLDQFAVLAQRDPNGFYQVMQTLSHYIENGELKNFFTLVRRSLSEPTR